MILQFVVLQQVDLFLDRSMVDIFVLLVTLASFNISIKSPDLSFLPDNLYSFNMLVVPLWGLYANLVRTLIIRTHQSICMDDVLSSLQSDVSLLSHSFIL